MTFRIASLAFALALALVPGRVHAQLAPLPLPHEVGAAEAWKAFRQRPTDPALWDNIGRLGGMLGEDGEVSAEACESGALKDLEPLLPISLSLWWMQIECAERAGDEAAAERALQAFAALARHALEQSPKRYAEGAPAPVLSELDVWLLIRGLELELGYIYMDLQTGGAYAPFYVSLWDAEEKREHLLALDLIDVYMDRIESSEKIRSPGSRIALQRSFVKASSEQGDELPSARALQLTQALHAAPAERSSRLLALANEGDFNAASRLFQLCSVRRRGECATQTVDALLPYAEAELAEALSMLATAHATGLGVRRDERAADRLYARADARLGGHEASLAAARQWLQPPVRGELPKPLRKRLQTASREGNTAADDLLLLSDIGAAIEAGASKSRLRKLAAAADSNSAWVRTGYGMALLDSDPEAALVQLAEGARLGGFANARGLLAALDSTGLQPLDDSELLAIHRRVGYGGGVESALWVGRHYRKHDPASAEALQWLMAAHMLGSSDGGYELAELMVDQWMGDDSLKMAAGTLDEVLARGPHAEAELLLADLLLQGVGGVKADPARAARLIRAQHAKGNVEASQMLAANLLSGRIQAEPGESPREMLEQAAARGNADAMDSLALAIYSGEIEAEPAAAHAWWRKAIAAGLVGARNNKAWTQCVSTDPRFHDPAAGLTEALQMGEAADLPHAYRDTLATCHAATGDFERAIAIERSILEEQAATETPAEARAYFTDKLAMFERGEAFREPPSALGSGEEETPPAQGAD